MGLGGWGWMGPSHALFGICVMTCALQFESCILDLAIQDSQLCCNLLWLVKGGVIGWAPGHLVSNPPDVS